MPPHLPLAYIDPMSGSILLQVIIAGTLAVFATCSRRVVRVFSWLAGRKEQPTHFPTETPPGEQQDGDGRLRKAG